MAIQCLSQYVDVRFYQVIDTDDISKCGHVGMLQSEYQALIQQSQTEAMNPDYASMGAVFSFFFSVTLGVWLLSKNLGVILQAIRRI
jgi:hypothetical protein